MSIEDDVRRLNRRVNALETFDLRARVKLSRPTAKAPQYMTAGAAGADVFADLSDSLPDALRMSDGKFFLPSGTHKIPLGFAVEVPDGWVGLLKGRSGSASRGNEAHVAAIDSDYRGEVCMLLHVGELGMHIDHGDRVGQILFMPAPQFKIEVVDELSETARGVGGFGSTGAR